VGRDGRAQGLLKAIELNLCRGKVLIFGLSCSRIIVDAGKGGQEQWSH
jgi:hypothetical protein